MSNNDHKANQVNKEKGTSGTYSAYQKVIDNRSKQQIGGKAGLFFIVKNRLAFL